MASLFALRAGAEVTHVDASKQILKWAKENQIVSGLENSPMRIIEDDVIKFLEREEKRGNKLIEELNNQEQQIVVLRYFKGKTQTEVAKKLGISQVQVSRIEKRILLNMKQKLVG